MLNVADELANVKLMIATLVIVMLVQPSGYEL